MLDRYGYVFQKQANPGLFLFVFVLFKHKFYRKNCRIRRDLNSDRWNLRQARRPLDHHDLIRVLYGCLDKKLVL